MCGFAHKGKIFFGTAAFEILEAEYDAVLSEVTVSAKTAMNLRMIKELGDSDIQDIYNLCRENKLYYEYCPPMVTEESIKKDMN